MGQRATAAQIDARKRTSTLKTADGQEVQVVLGGRRRKKEEPQRKRRPAHLVAIGVRQSQMAGRHLQRDAEYHLHGPQIDLDKCQRIADERGQEVVGIWHFQDYSGADMERIEPFIRMMEADPPELDAIIVPDWSRFSRSSEGPSYVERIKAAGGDLIVADMPQLDIYDETSDIMVAVLNMVSVQQRTQAAKKRREIAKSVVKQGRAGYEHYCWEWVEQGHDVRLPNGTLKHYPRGSLKPVPDEIAYGREIYKRLFARELPGDIATWLDENGQRTRGKRRLLYDEQGDPVMVDGYHKGETPRQGSPWDSTKVLMFARSPLNKGYVRYGEFIAKGIHFEDAFVEEQVWDEVNDLYVPTTDSRDADYPVELLRGLLRCTGCRGTLSVDRDDDGNPIRYSCHNKRCTARASVVVQLIEPYIEACFMKVAKRHRAELTATEIGRTDDQRRQLGRAVEEAESELQRWYANDELARANPEGWTVQCKRRERELKKARDAERAFLRGMKVQLGDVTLPEKYPTWPVPKRRTKIRATWPLIWVRKSEHLDDAGFVRRNRPIEDRVWLRPEGDERDWLLPRKGVVYNAEAHVPVRWRDGTLPLTAAEARRVREERHILKREHYAAARAHYKAHGRTDEECFAAIEAADGNVTAAAEALGMPPKTLAYRWRVERVRRGEIEDATLAEKLKRKRYLEGRRPSDEDINKALELRDGNIAAAARELGMPYASLYARVRRPEDRKPLRREAPEGLLEAVGRNEGNVSAAARELGMSPGAAHYWYRRMLEAQLGLEPPTRKLEGPPANLLEVILRNDENVSAAARELGLKQATVAGWARKLRHRGEWVPQKPRPGRGRPERVIPVRFIEVLERNRGNAAKTARELGLKRPTAQEWARKLRAEAGGGLGSGARTARRNGREREPSAGVLLLKGEREGSLKAA